MKNLAPLLTGMLQRGTRSNGESKPAAAGDVVLLLGEGTGKIVVSEDFAAFLFLFPVGLCLDFHVIADGYIDISVCAYVYFTNFLYVVTPRALCPHVSDLVWGKYVTTKLL